MYTIIAKALVPTIPRALRKKHCSGCDAYLPRGHFWRNRSKKDGLDDLCKDCREIANEKSKARKETFEFNTDMSEWKVKE